MAAHSATNAGVPVTQKPGARIRRGAFSLNDVKNEDLALVQVHHSHRAREKGGDEDQAKTVIVNKSHSRSKGRKVDAARPDDGELIIRVKEEGSSVDKEVNKYISAHALDRKSKNNDDIRVERRSSVSSHSSEQSDSMRLHGTSGNKSVIDLIPDLKDTKLVAPTPSQEFGASLVSTTGTVTMQARPTHFSRISRLNLKMN